MASNTGVSVDDASSADTDKAAKTKKIIIIAGVSVAVVAIGVAVFFILKSKGVF